MLGVESRARIESLLQARKLDGTLTTAAPWSQRRPDAGAPTGLAALDTQLGGGFPRGHLSEIVGPRSAGRTTVLCQTLASAVARGELVAVIDTCDRFDPWSAAAMGLDVSKLLWVRERGDASSALKALKALKAMMLVLQAGGFGIVAFDLADVHSHALRGFPFTTWLRLARAVEGRETVALLIGQEHLARSPGGVTVSLEPAAGASRARWAGSSHRARLLSGLELRARVVGGQCEYRRTTI
jgi:hypothetical protein